MKKKSGLYKNRVVTTLVYLDTLQKDVYSQRPILEANEFLYDSSSRGKPIYIPSEVLKDVRFASTEVPLVFGHRNKHIKLGYLDNFNYDNRNKVLRADIHVYPRWNEWVLHKLSEGNNGLSTEFKSIDKSEQFFNRILGLIIERVAIVPRPASHKSKFY